MNEADRLIVLALIGVVILVLSIMFWLRFYRMMDDVRRMADKIAPKEPEHRPERKWID